MLKYSKNKNSYNQKIDNTNEAKDTFEKIFKSTTINNFLSFEPETLESLLSHCFNFLSRYIAYKEIKMPVKGFIIYEMPQFKIK